MVRPWIIYLPTCVQGTSEAAKKIAAEAFSAALVGVPRTNVDQVLQGLDIGARATVMKYVYKAMSLPADKKTYDHLLAWHGKLVTVVCITY